MDGTANRVPHSEEVAAESIRRLWIRRASVIVVLSQGLAFAIGAILPTTPDMDRTGLIVGAALVGLTGLANRQVLVDGFARMLSTANRRGVPVSVVALDLDGMKAVNDRHGHAAGDRLLVHFANLVRSCGRGADLAVRAGGDEFILLLPDTDRAGALRVVQRLRDAAIASGPDVRFSAGVATSSPDATVEWLLALADDALYAAKATRSDGQR